MKTKKVQAKDPAPNQPAVLPSAYSLRSAVHDSIGLSHQPAELISGIEQLLNRNFGYPTQNEYSSTTAQEGKSHEERTLQEMISLTNDYTRDSIERLTRIRDFIIEVAS